MCRNCSLFRNSDVPRLARHVHKLSVEERNHAMMVVQYFLDRDFSVELSGVDAGKSTPRDITPIGRGYRAAITMGPPRCGIGVRARTRR